jgi:hypothetical protein
MWGLVVILIMSIHTLERIENNRQTVHYIIYLPELLTHLSFNNVIFLVEESRI